MSAILRRIRELVVHRKLDKEQFRNLQESERYVIHVSGTKYILLMYLCTDVHEGSYKD